MKEKLFTRFERGLARGSGEGLGLFIVRTLVERCGGKVWVDEYGSLRSGVPVHASEGGSCLSEGDRARKRKGHEGWR